MINYIKCALTYYSGELCFATALVIIGVSMITGVVLQDGRAGFIVFLALTTLLCLLVAAWMLYNMHQFIKSRMEN